MGRRVVTSLDPGKLASGRGENSDPDREAGPQARRSFDREPPAHQPNPLFDAAQAETAALLVRFLQVEPVPVIRHRELHFCPRRAAA